MAKALGKDMLEKMKSAIPLGRLGAAGEVAGL